MTPFIHNTLENANSSRQREWVSVTWRWVGSKGQVGGITKGIKKLRGDGYVQYLACGDGFRF